MAELPSPNEQIVVIGDSALRTGFSLAGLTHLYPASSAAEGEALLQKLMADPQVGIIIVDERMLEAADWRLRRKIEMAAKPVVVAVPGRDGPVEQSESISKLVKRALGFDLMKRPGAKNSKHGNESNGKNGDNQNNKK